MIPAQVLLDYSNFVVTPGSSTFDSGSGNFSVPNYNTLTVEVWGGGGTGLTESRDNVFVGGNNGVASTCSTLSMTANGGTADSGSTTYTGAGGTASGGNTTNTTGSVGGNASFYTPAGDGHGAGAPSGGGNVAAATSNNTSGNTGSTPGGGGSGLKSSTGAVASGGPSGGYCKSVYTRGVTTGAPNIGDLLAYAVGAGGASTGSPVKCGAGANGRVKFTWS